MNLKHFVTLHYFLSLLQSSCMRFNRLGMVKYDR